jgi:hypothetical protein
MFAKLREKLKGWKTIIVNVVLGIAGAAYPLYLQLQSVDLTPVIPAKYVAFFVVGNALIGIGLRCITTGPIGSKGDEAPAPDTKAGD